MLINQRKNKPVRPITVRSRARELLFAEGNYMTLVLSLIICVSPSMLSYMLAALVSDFTYPWVSDAMLLSMLFLVGAPFILGVVKVSVSVYRKKEAPLAELFFAFSSPIEYVRSLCLIAIQLVKILLELIPTLTAYFFLDKLLRMYGVMGFFASLIGAVAAVAVLLLIKTLLSRLYGTLFYALEGDETRVIKALVRSWKECKGRTFQTMRIRLTTLPMLILSALPLGIPLLLYALPYSMCAYACTVDALNIEKRLAEAVDTEDVTPDNEIITENGDINNE